MSASMAQVPGASDNGIILLRAGDAECCRAFFSVSAQEIPDSHREQPDHAISRKRPAKFPRWGGFVSDA
jgi:hypothetical protein